MGRDSRYQDQRIPLQLSRGRIVASIQIELSESVLDKFRSDLLEFVRNTHATGVVMDFSGLEVMDASEFTELRRIVDMARLMGSDVVVAGLRPGIVSSLIALEVNLDGLVAAFDLDDAFELLSRRDKDYQEHELDDGLTDPADGPLTTDMDQDHSHDGDFDALPDL